MLRCLFVLACIGTMPVASSQVLTPIELFAFRSPSLDESGIGGQNSMSVLGDVNGDGIADLAAGAAGDDNNAGRVYVLSGADGTPLNAFVSPRDVEAEGFGDATAGPGDLDGDGTPDLIVGATGADPEGVSGAGRVYAINISTKAVLWTAVSPNPTEDGLFGYALATVPDVDGDGVTDIVVGAPDEGVVDADGELQGDAGRTYLLSGRTGAVLLSLVPENPDDTFPSAFGGLRGSDFGYAVTGLADAQGRGVLAVGAPGEWTGDFDTDPAKYDGRLYISQPATSSTRRTRSTNAWDRGNFANSIAGTPDLDGDGFGDLIVGAPSESLSDDEDDEGQGYLVSGATGLPLRRFASPQQYDDSSFGWQVGAVPDVNRNGHTDLLFTEPTLCCEKIDALYVFDGITGELAASLEVPNTRFDINDAIGLPDLDGDGRSEVMVGISVGTFDEVDYVVVVPVSSPQAELEPNDAIDTPQEIGGASPIVIRSVVGGGDLGFDGSQLLVQEGEIAEDLFLVETTAPGLTVTLSDFGSGTDEEDLDLYVLDPETLSFHGTSATLSATETVSLPSLPAGRHLIAVDFYGSFGDASNSFDYAFYSLTVEGAFTSLVTTDVDAPGELVLEPPFPNPARGHTTLAYTLPESGPVRLAVFDALGREVARVVDRDEAAGRHTRPLNGLGLAPGVYRIRLDACGQTRTRSFVLAR
ncbi:MAG: hypothetical protein Rubg2KO_23680 [Rubricoccaceae bacterium]